MRVTLVQTEIDPRAPFAERVAGVCETVAACRDSHLVMLPELWATGYFAFDEYPTTAEPLSGPTCRALAAAAREAGVHLHGGSIVERDDAGRLFNTSLLFGPDGRLLHTYRKFHLFGYGSRESALLTPGDQVLAWPTPVGSVGLTTCYDLRFPELFRVLVDGGAELFLVTAAWPAARVEHWRLLLRARALESLALVVGCNAAGRQGDVLLAGHSAIVDPWGRVLAEAGDAGQTLTVEVDPDVVASTRAEFPALVDRRLPVPPPTSAPLPGPPGATVPPPGSPAAEAPELAHPVLP